MREITRRTFGKLLGISAGSYLCGVTQQPQEGWINLPQAHIHAWMDLKGYWTHIHKDRPEGPHWQRVDFLTSPDWHTHTFTVDGRSESYVYCLGCFTPNQPSQPSFSYSKGGVSLYLPERRVAHISLREAT